MGNELYPIINGAESLFYSGNHIGVILCHGFNGTPQSMQLIGEQLSKKGYTVSIPRLTGHGTHYSDLENCGYEDWISDLQAAYDHVKKQCHKVFIVGQSMGGALTLQLAANNSNVDGIFLINAAVTDVSYNQFRNNVRPCYIEEGTPDIKKPAVFEITYDKVPLKSIQQLLFLMDDTKEKVHQVSCPTIIFKSTIDNVVSPKNSDFIYKTIHSADKSVIELRNSFHVASLDNDVQQIVDNINVTIKEKVLISQ